MQQFIVTYDFAGKKAMTAAIDHSAISPSAKVRTFFVSANFFYIFFELFFK